jgi:drug/metabolite transporter (DMT)-like permease
MMIAPVSRRSRFPLTRGGGAALALAAASVSGLSIFLNEYAVQQAPDAAAYTTAKNLVAAALLGAIALTSMRGRVGATVRGLSRGALLAVLLVGILGGGVAFALFFEGLRHTSSTDAAFIQKTLIVWVAIAAVPLLKERLGPGHVAAIVLLVLGQLLLAGGVVPLFPRSGGEVMILVATLLWSGEIIVARILLRSLPSQLLAAARMLIGTAFLLVFLWITGQGHGLAALGATGWGWALLTGALLTLYVSTWLAALSRAPAIDVTALLVAGAFITALLNASAGHATLTSHALALILILAGTGTMLVLTLRIKPLLASAPA